jgi:hypothetical protein
MSFEQEQEQAALQSELGLKIGRQGSYARRATTQLLSRLFHSLCSTLSIQEELKGRAHLEAWLLQQRAMARLQ